MLNAINLDSTLSNVSANAFLNITASFSFFWWCDSAPQF